MTEGWVFLYNWRKAHYIRGGTSLCQKWGYWGKNFEADSESPASKDDCLACRRILDKEGS